MPYAFRSSIEEFAEKLHKWFIIVNAEGDVNECDTDTPVVVGILWDESGYGPHTASIFVQQNKYHGDEDSALQAAAEIHEEWMQEHYSDHLEELMAERLEEHVKNYLDTHRGVTREEAVESVQDDAYQEADEWFRETTNGTAWTMTTEEFFAALDSWPSDKYTQVILDGVTITRREECEEPEEVEDPGYNVVDRGHPRMSSTRRVGGRPETYDAEANYQKFIDGLTQLTRHYGVALQCVGGVYIAGKAGEFKDVSYTADSSSGDLIPDLPKDWR